MGWDGYAGERSISASSPRAFAYFCCRRASSFVGSRMAWALESNTAFLVVGNLLGATALGLYSVAYRVPSMVPVAFRSEMSCVWLVGALPSSAA